MDEQEMRAECAKIASECGAGGLAGGTIYEDFAVELAKRVQVAERERCAKLCDKEADYRTARERNPFPGDLEPAVQGHKAVTARLLAHEIRSLKVIDLDAELEKQTGEPHIDGWRLYSGLPPKN